MRNLLAWLATAALLPAGMAAAYPLYGSEQAGIGRVEHARLAHEGVVEGRQRVKGELLSLGQVDLRLLDRPDLELPAPDPDFSRAVAALLSEAADLYGLAVLDLSDPSRPRYGEINGEVPRNPGSVGKILAALALFQALADAYPEDMAKRFAVLRDTRVTADDFILRDHHPVRFWNSETRASNSPTRL